MGVAIRHIIIVGGGASGALLALNLLRASGGVTATLIESRPLLARGFAYGEAAPFHLLNVRAANMSAYLDVPDHLLDWLDGTSSTENVTGEGRFRFVPRRIYGRYLAEQLDALTLSPLGRDRLQTIHGLATSLERTTSGVVVGLENGRQIAGDAVVLATGYGVKPQNRFPHQWLAWAPIDTDALASVQDVLILGTGHSAIDHVQLLLAAGYRGRMTLLSRHGFMPSVHKPVEPARIDAREVPFGARLSAVWRWVRILAKQAESAGSDWRAVLDGLRPHAQELWQSLSDAEQARFIRHARSRYDVRRHRLAPFVANVLGRLHREDRLRVIAGRLQSVSDIGEAAEVVIGGRGTDFEQKLVVQGIIDCRGFELDPAQSNNPVLQSLLTQGLARTGRHGFGLAVDRDCALIDASGEAASDLYAIGPLTRGQFWESISIPDIRQQTAVLANHLVNAHATSSV